MFTQQQLDQIDRDLQAGLSIEQVAQRFNISRSTFERRLASENGLQIVTLRKLAPTPALLREREEVMA